MSKDIDTEEVWKECINFPMYAVSNLGRVKALAFMRWTNGKNIYPEKLINTPQQSKVKFYLKVSLHDGVERVSSSLHRLVAENFLGNPLNLPCVNHKDGNPKNNCVTNLEWVTYKENTKHAYALGLSKGRAGTENSMAKMTEDEVTQILIMFYHNLLTCKQIEDITNIMKEYIALVVTGKRWKILFNKFVNSNSCDLLEVKKILSKRRARNMEIINNKAGLLMKGNIYNG